MSSVITVENLGKHYNMYHQQCESYTSLRDVITNGVRNISKAIFSPPRFTSTLLSASRVGQVFHHHFYPFPKTLVATAPGNLRSIKSAAIVQSRPTIESLTRDIPLLVVGVVWVIMVGWGIYGR